MRLTLTEIRDQLVMLRDDLRDDADPDEEYKIERIENALTELNDITY